MSEEFKPATSIDDDGTIKVDFSKNAVQEQSTDEVPVQDEPAVSEEIQSEDVEETVEQPAGESTVETDEPVEEAIEEHLAKSSEGVHGINDKFSIYPEGLFEKTDEWDDLDSHDRTWS